MPDRLPVKLGNTININSTSIKPIKGADEGKICHSDPNQAVEIIAHRLRSNCSKE